MVARIKIFSNLLNFRRKTGEGTGTEEQEQARESQINPALHDKPKFDSKKWILQQLKDEFPEERFGSRTNLASFFDDESEQLYFVEGLAEKLSSLPGLNFKEADFYAELDDKLPNTVDELCRLIDKVINGEHVGFFDHLAPGDENLYY